MLPLPPERRTSLPDTPEIAVLGPMSALLMLVPSMPSPLLVPTLQQEVRVLVLTDSCRFRPLLP
jgi:hypothetical protein